MFSFLFYYFFLLIRRDNLVYVFHGDARAGDGIVFEFFTCFSSSISVDSVKIRTNEIIMIVEGHLVTHEFVFITV